MNIKSFIISFITRANFIIKNPNIYVAAVVGTGLGLCAGGFVGGIAGGSIGYALQLSAQYINYSFPVNPDIVLGGIVGLSIGSLVGAAVIGSITCYKVHKKTQNQQVLSYQEMPKTLLSSLGVGLEIAIGMVLGGIIGSLKTPGTGTLLGALAGTVLMIISGTLKKKSPK